MKRFMISAAILASFGILMSAPSAEAGLFGKKKGGNDEGYSQVVYRYVESPVVYTTPAPTYYVRPTYYYQETPTWKPVVTSPAPLYATRPTMTYGQPASPQPVAPTPQAAPTSNVTMASFTSPAPAPVQAPAPVAAPAVATAAPSLPQVAPGSPLTLSASELGDNIGMVTIGINGLTMPVEIISWTPAAVTLRMPTMKMNATTAAELNVIRADGTLARTVNVALLSGVTDKL